MHVSTIAMPEVQARLAYREYRQAVKARRAAETELEKTMAAEDKAV